MKHFATKLLEIDSELEVAMCQTGVGRKGIQKSRLIAHEWLVVFLFLKVQKQGIK